MGVLTARRTGEKKKPWKREPTRKTGVLGRSKTAGRDINQKKNKLKRASRKSASTKKNTSGRPIGRQRHTGGRRMFH